MFSALALGLFLLASVPAQQSIAQQSTAQPLGETTSGETIYGTEIEVGQLDDVTIDQVIAALDGLSETVTRVIMTYKLDTFEVVYLGDEEPPLGSERLSESIAEHNEDIGALRRKMGTSAIFLVAFEAQNLDVDRIVAADISDEDEVTVFVSGRER
ncbi:hypothetical protein ACFQEX_10455 [Roseibium salinum]|nr:hypothetical protein [Roseibium salinum]